MSDFLAEMVTGARERVAAAREAVPLARPAGERPGGGLLAALAAPAARDGVAGPPASLALVAEVKRRSPSKGAIAPDLDAVAQARAYEAAGADAVSVLTEPSRFGGSLEDLRAVAAAVSLPVLRKDFIVDPYQVWEAAAAGAAAVLLIVAALSDRRLGDLLEECALCGLDALVEVHDEAEMERALASGATLIGVNNRDLRTLTVDLGATERLAHRVPPHVLLVSESGISDAADARRMALAGARALLVGETLVRAGTGDLSGRVHTLRSAGASSGGAR
jgi:indole-3-glycerol phosphate synthase